MLAKWRYGPPVADLADRACTGMRGVLLNQFDLAANGHLFRTGLRVGSSNGVLPNQWSYCLRFDRLACRGLGFRPACSLDFGGHPATSMAGWPGDRSWRGRRESTLLPLVIAT